MSEIKNKKAVAVGIFVFAGLLFLVIGILTIGNLHETFKSKIKIVALFDDVGGLQSGNNIWFSGVKVGTVSSLQFYDQRRVKVEMKVEEKAQQYIRKDAFVKLSTDGLIGNKILIIYGGSAQSPQVEAGDTLSVQKTFSSDDMINVLQENNKNLLAITGDFKVISSKLVRGEGTAGKLLGDNTIYTSLQRILLSLEKTSDKADRLMGSIAQFSEGLNKKGSLANELVNDTSVFNSIRLSALHLQKITDTTTVLINRLKDAENDTHSPLGILLHDQESGLHLKQFIKNLETSSHKLDEDLEAAQHNFLLRGFFKKREKETKSKE